jgi:hypothetical protein
MFPMRPAIPERQTRDYKHHGTTTLFAALEIANRCQPFAWTKDADTILAKAQRSPKTKDVGLT